MARVRTCVRNSGLQFTLSDGSAATAGKAILSQQPCYLTRLFLLVRDAALSRYISASARSTSSFIVSPASRSARPIEASTCSLLGTEFA